MESESQAIRKKCAKCGSCMSVCPLYQVTGRESDSARGKIHLLDRMPDMALSKNLGRILSSCLLCGACGGTCPRGIDFRDRLVGARQVVPAGGAKVLQRLLIRQGLSRPRLLAFLGAAGLKGFDFLKFLPGESGLRLRLGLVEDNPSQDACPGAGFRKKAQRLPKWSAPSTFVGGGPHISYFSGCFAAYLEPAIAEAVMTLCEIKGPNRLTRPTAQTCCGLASLGAGDIEAARRLARANIAAFEEDDSPILTSCASCYSHLLGYPELFTGEPQWRERADRFAARIIDLSEHLMKSVSDADTPPDTSSNDKMGSIYLHAPCHGRFGRGRTTAPRDLLARLAGMSPRSIRVGNRCCGMGGLFHLAHPHLAAAVGKPLMDEIRSFSPQTVITSCSGCLLHIRALAAATGLPIQVRHIAGFLRDLHKGLHG